MPIFYHTCLYSASFLCGIALDLLLTRKGFIIVRSNKVQTLRDYARISYAKYKNKETLQLGWPDTFANDSICIGALYDLIEKIEEKLLESK